MSGTQTSHLRLQAREAISKLIEKHGIDTMVCPPSTDVVSKAFHTAEIIDALVKGYTIALLDRELPQR